MNKENELIACVMKLERRVTSLEAKASEMKKSLHVDIENPKTLPDHIAMLREKKFFSKPQTSKETYKKLLESYQCELNRVEVSLLKMADKRQLRKTSKVIDGKKYKAYVW